MDIFNREQQIFDRAVDHLNDMLSGAPYDLNEYGLLVKEYGRLLRQLRRVTRISDKTTNDLNTSKLDLMDKVHYDALTSIYNRRFMEESLKHVMRSSSRSKNGMLSMLMLDVDHFKRYNDTYGHSAGDECLKTVARVLKESVARTEDFVARYGGEEFVIVLPETDKTGAVHIAEKILENIRACNIPHEKNDAADCVTISIGVTTGVVLHTQTGADYIRQADKALYMSKQNGRNRYTFLEFTEERQ